MASMLQFLQSHPLLSGLLAFIVLLAVIGLWYVISNHLQAILITLICTAGAAAGAVVVWRGVTHDLGDLIAVGAFLIVIFPVIYMQAIRRERRPLQVPVTQLPGVVRPIPGATPIKRG
jgi:hypothetical protein